jgi:tellurium resistance protein TerD
MSFDLEKGSSFEISKEAPNLKIVGVGLGWKTDFDLDVSAFCIGEDGHIPNRFDFVYYKSNNKVILDGESLPRPYSFDGAVYGSIDQTSGSSDVSSDDDSDLEDMWIFLDRVGSNINEIVVVVTIHNSTASGFYMRDVPDCYCRIWDQDTGHELCRYTLSEEFRNEDAVEIGKFSRVASSGWKFTAIGNGVEGGLIAFIKKYAYRY